MKHRYNLLIKKLSCLENSQIDQTKFIAKGLRYIYPSESLEKITYRMYIYSLTFSLYVFSLTQVQHFYFSSLCTFFLFDLWKKFRIITKKTNGLSTFKPCSLSEHACTVFDIDIFCLSYYLQNTTFQCISFPTMIVHVYHCCSYRYNEEYTCNYRNNSSNDSTVVFRSAFITRIFILVFIDSRCYSTNEIKNMINYFIDN